MIPENRLLPWQIKDWRSLHQYIEQQRVPQALLCVGHKGMGKHVIMEQFACSLLCKQPALDGLNCGECSSCHLLKAGTHPDLIHLQPEEEGKVIKIDQIRHILTQLSLKPQYDAYRVVIINPADQLNIAAANAFLKFLEEPTERTVLILITDKPATLPKTIISRCQKFEVAKPGKSLLEQWMLQHVQEPESRVLLALAQGSPLLALHYAQNNSIKLRQDCFNDWLALAEQRSSAIEIAERWIKWPLESLLFWLTSWVIDTIRCRYNAPVEQLYNADLVKPLQVCSQKLELKKLYGYYDLLLQSKPRLATQLNKQLLVEELLLKWSELNRPGTQYGRIST